MRWTTAPVIAVLVLVCLLYYVCCVEEYIYRLRFKRTKIIAFSIAIILVFTYGGRNFAGRCQGATPNLTPITPSVYGVGQKLIDCILGLLT